MNMETVYENVEKQFKARCRALGCHENNPDELDTYLEKQAEFFLGAMTAMTAMVDEREPNPKKRDYSQAMPINWLLLIIHSRVIGTK